MPIIDRLLAAAAPDDAIAAHNAWLWEQVERPEVVEAVAIANFEYDNDMLAWGRAPYGMRKGYVREAKASAHTLLTALIGPKPGEATDDN